MIGVFIFLQMSSFFIGKTVKKMVKCFLKFKL